VDFRREVAHVELSHVTNLVPYRYQLALKVHLGAECDRERV
jgi:hypothetical protein